MIRVVLHGFLGKKFGRKHRYEARSAGEAYRALCATLPGFERAFTSFPHQFVFVADGRQLMSPREGELFVERELHVAPHVAGAGKVLKIIAGAVIAVVGAYFGQAWAVQLGVGLMLSGVADFLTKSPSLAVAKAQVDSEKTESYFFRGPLNTTEQGVPVPVAYGDIFMGSVVISAGIRTYETTGGMPAPSPPITDAFPVDPQNTVPIDPMGQRVGNVEAFLASGGLVSYGWEETT
jgi:predicted phage tail protein